MKQRVEAILVQLLVAIRQNPVEVLLSAVFCLIGCFNYESRGGIDCLEGLLIYFPVIFLLTNLLNRTTKEKKARWIYFLSVLLPIPFLWVDAKIETATYIISLVVVQLLYLSSEWQRDNIEFVRAGLSYLKSILSSLLLAGIAYLLAVSIYFSIRYIFEIWENNETRVLVYTAYIAFMGIMPLLFLMFHREKEEGDGENKLFDVLLNYVLSPALLIYAAILYLYFIKVTVLWSLPKGAVAYIVVSFTVATFVLKGFQPFLSTRYYDWFYKYSSMAVLPALVMYWVGVYYRINQYGFTELRVYLVIVGLILTCVVFLFFSKRAGRYLYTACLTILLLSAVTYIPGITAKDIEIMSQKSRGNDPSAVDMHDRYSSLQIENMEALDISGYQTLQPVSNYKLQHAIWLETKDDSMYLYGRNDSLIIKENLNRFLEERLSALHLTNGDSIPVSLYAQILRIDMDSALFVFENMSLYRYSPDSAYKVGYVTPGYYLKKRK